MTENSNSPQDHSAAASDITTGMDEVRPTAVESELDTIWRTVNARTLAGGAQAVSRNSVLTLVCYAQGEAKTRDILQVVETLTAIHPSRAVVVAAQASAEPQSVPVRAFVQTHTHTSNGSTNYGETVLIAAADGAAQHLPGTVLPLIVAGLPAFLWWAGDPPWGSMQLESMVDGCDRLIVDSSEMSAPEASLGALEDLLRRKASSCVVSDFNWTRQAPWRELVAQFFDGPDMVPYLRSIDRLSIEYAAGSESEPTNSAQAYLFAGWLASRIGWRLQSTQGATARDGAQHLLQDDSGRNLTLEISPRYGVPVKQWMAIHAAAQAEAHADDASNSSSNSSGDDASNPSTAGKTHPASVGPGALMSVYLRSHTSAKTASFTVAREADLQHASTLCQLDGSAPPSQTVHLPSLGEAAVLTEQLRIIGHDVVYEDALTMAAQLIGPRTRRARA